MTKVIGDLEVLDITEYSEFDRIIDNSRKKRKQKLAGASGCVPEINTGQKYVILPTSIRDEDNLLMKSIGRLAYSLGYTVKLTEYTGEKRELSKDEDDFIIGLSFVKGDENIYLNIPSSKSEDSIETGRHFVRAQQLLGYCVSKNSSNAILKKNHSFFGNDPGKTVKVGRSMIEVIYMAKYIPRYFKEVRWQDNLTNILLSLLKQSHQSLDAKVLSKTLESNVISLQELIKIKSTRSVLFEEKKGNKPAKYRDVVPHRPRRSTLMTNEEDKLVNKLTQSFFDKDFDVRIPPGKTWSEYLIETSYHKVVEIISRNAAERAKFIMKFAQLTTNRLKEFRKLSEANKSKRKRDLNSTDISTLLSNRPDPISKLAEEVMSLEDNNKILSNFVSWEEIKEGINYRSFLLDNIKQTIIADKVYYSLPSVRADVELSTTGSGIKDLSREAIPWNLEDSYFQDVLGLEKTPHTFKVSEPDLKEFISVVGKKVKDNPLTLSEILNLKNVRRTYYKISADDAVALLSSVRNRQMRSDLYMPTPGLSSPARSIDIPWDEQKLIPPVLKEAETGKLFRQKPDKKGLLPSIKVERGPY